MKYQKGDEVRIKSLDWYNKNKDESGSVFVNGVPFCEEMSEYCGAYVRIADVYDDYYTIRGVPYCWTDDMIERLTDAHCKLGIVPTEKGSELIPREGFEIKQEGEKFYLVKKNKYPKTYEECCEVLDVIDNREVWHGYRSVQLKIFQKLLIYRDAYWKIAGEEMGLGKPWTPQDTNTFSIFYDRLTYEIEKQDGYCGANSTLEFPTEEMRDAFHENFKELINCCKELL